MPILRVILILSLLGNALFMTIILAA